MRFKREIYERLETENPLELSPPELYKHIVSAIEPELPFLGYPGKTPIEIMPILDYGKEAFRAGFQKLSDIEGLDSAQVTNLVETGGSEGVYLTIGLKIRRYDEKGGCEEKTLPLFVYKTLEEGPEAYAAMGALGGMVTYALELFLYEIC